MEATRVVPPEIITSSLAPFHRKMRMIGIGAAVASVVLLLLIWMYSWLLSPNKKPEAPAAVAKVVSATPASAQCPGVRNTITFSPSVKVRYNPDGKCGTSLWHDGHCVFIQQAGNSTVFGPVCDPSVQPKDRALVAPPRDPEWVWSADTQFEGSYALVPPRYAAVFR